MTVIPYVNCRVGEHIPIRFSFLKELLSFINTGQSLTGASIAWVSQTPARATFDVGSGGLTTSDDAAAQGISNDACVGRFQCLTEGTCTVTVTVDAINPIATYVGIVQLQIEAIPTP